MRISFWSHGGGIFRTAVSIFAALIFVLNSSTAVVAQDADVISENIHQYNVEIVVQKDASLDITEQIDYDFGLQERHGIYRDIPYLYTIETDQGQKTYELDVDVTSVENELGTPYSYEILNENDNVRIKIGDANKTISGEHTYIIRYNVAGGIRYFADHDELYWNAIGTGWAVPIDNVNVKVSHSFEVPDTVGGSEPYRYRCLTGVFGSKEECDVAVEGHGIASFQTSNLEPYEGMSVVTSFPKGYVEFVEPREREDFFDTILGKILIVVFVIVGALWYIILPFWIAMSWYLYGRDPDVGVAPTAHFDPPETEDGRQLTPAETGVLMDENVHMRDVLSTVVDLARKGYIQIEEREKKDFYLEKKTDISKNVEKPELTNFEKTLLEGIFTSKTLIRLKDTQLATTVQEVKNQLYDGIVTAGFFKKNPENTRLKYSLLGILGLFTGNIQLFLTSIIFGRNMPRKTIFGAREANKAKGLYSFLKSQERQLNFKEMDPQIMFEKLLPYAIAFGVEKQWMERFKDISLVQPEWYSSYGTGKAFNQAHMMNSMQSSFSSFSSAANPVSSSSGFSGGGGSSGGGGGGGGGGSW